MGWLRDIAVGGQGLARGLASGVGAIADIPAGIGNLGVMAANQFREDDNQIEHFEGFNMADRAAEAVTFTEARNDRERAIMSGAQAVGEVGAFVAVTVGTAGLGGAAVGGAGVATRWAGATARVMNPVNVTGRVNQAVTTAEVGLTGHRAYDLYTTDQEAAQNVGRIYENSIDGLATDIEREQEMMQDKATTLTEELQGMSENLLDPNLTIGERQELLDRLDLIEEGLTIIRDIDDVEDMDQRQDMLDRLEVIQPTAADQEANNTLRSPLRPSVDVGGNEVRTAFDAGVANEAGVPATPAQQVDLTLTAREFA